MDVLQDIWRCQEEKPKVLSFFWKPELKSFSDLETLHLDIKNIEITIIEDQPSKEPEGKEDGEKNPKNELLDPVNLFIDVRNAEIGII